MLSAHSTIGYSSLGLEKQYQLYYMSLKTGLARHSRTVGNAGLLVLAIGGYLYALHVHYEGHPEARNDGWMPLEWRSLNTIAHLYHQELIKLEEKH